MNITILGTESMGVRGLSCVIETEQHKIVIDPGLALGYHRQHLLPHPLQVEVGKIVRKRIIESLSGCTDVVFSHFHGDHIPLPDANPFQLSADEVAELFHSPNIWCKGCGSGSSVTARRYEGLSQTLHRDLPNSEGREVGPLSFSDSVPHGEPGSRLGEVMMTRVEDKGGVFVHASDIQLLDPAPIRQILAWKPDVVLASGPPLYLAHCSPSQRRQAFGNAVRLAEGTGTLILDHHLLRCEEGFHFLEEISDSTGNRVICAADYVGCTRLPLEAWRQKLYENMPVPQGWHEAYFHGDADTHAYRTWQGTPVEDLLPSSRARDFSS